MSKKKEGGFHRIVKTLLSENGEQAKEIAKLEAELNEAYERLVEVGLMYKEDGRYYDE